MEIDHTALTGYHQSVNLSIRTSLLSLNHCPSAARSSDEIHPSIYSPMHSVYVYSKRMSLICTRMHDGHPFIFPFIHHSIHHPSIHPFVCYIIIISIHKQLIHSFIHHASMHPCIHASMHPCIHASIHASMHPCMHASIHPSIHPPTHSLTHLPIHPSIHP